MGLLSYTTLASPVGPLLLAADQLGLGRVCFENSKRTKPPPPHWKQDRGPLLEVIRSVEGFIPFHRVIGSDGSLTGGVPGIRKRRQSATTIRDGYPTLTGPAIA